MPDAAVRLGWRRPLVACVAATAAMLGAASGPVAGAGRAAESSPVGAYGFSAGERAADAVTGHARAARLHRAGWTPAGRRGGGLRLGRHGWASLMAARPLRAARGVTLEAWVRPSGRVSGTLLAGAARGQSPFGIVLRRGVPAVYVVAGRGRRLARARRALPPHRWSFVAARVSRGHVVLDVGARRAASRRLALRPSASTARAVLVGRAPGGRATFAGVVDDVRLYDRAITASRVAADRRTGVSGQRRGGSGGGSGQLVGGAPPPGGGGAPGPPTDPSLPPQPTEGNLWVDADGGTCARRPAPGPYVDGDACASLQTAFESAAPGDVVLIRGGSYGAQVIGVRAAMSSASADVVFEVAPGEVVTFTGDVDVLGSHVILRGRTNPYNMTMAQGTKLKVDHWTTPTSGSDRTHDVRVEGIDGANFQIGPVAGNVTIKGGDWGPSTSCAGGDENVISGADGQTPNGITLDGVLVHDQNTTSTASCHTGGLLIQGSTNLTIRNSRFWKDTIYDVLFDDFTGSFQTRHITLENNWFAPPVNPLPDDASPDPAAADVQVKWNGVAADDWLVRFNSFGNGMDASWNGDPPSWSGYRFIGNTGGTIWDGLAYEACRGAGRPGVTIAYNALVAIDDLDSSGSRAPTCGSATNVSLGTVGDYGDLSRHPYVSGSITSPDFHLRAGTAAQDRVPAGTPDSGVASDIDGNARPAGPARDAGADERG